MVSLNLILFCVIFNLFNNNLYVNGLFDQYYYSCYFKECCVPHSEWMPLNMNKFENDIKKFLYGQHLAELVLLKNFKFHVLKRNPDKALLLVFNGMSGIGKNYAANLIVESLFTKGHDSKYVHVFVGFTNEKDINEYKETIQRTIIEAVKKCPYSVFIFDDVHNIEGNTLNSISPFFEPYSNINGVDMRRTIFILLSNSAGLSIENRYIQALKNNRNRESIQLHELERLGEDNTFSIEDDGLRKSYLFSHNLVTAYVPFLPLEKSHVRSCIKSYIKSQGYEEKEDIIENVMKILTFIHMNVTELSESGCKRVAEKTQLYF